jgi:hypothetical protein
LKKITFPICIFCAVLSKNDRFDLDGIQLGGFGRSHKQDSAWFRKQNHAAAQCLMNAPSPPKPTAIAATMLMA